MTIVVDAPKSIEIAERFLEKHHDTVNVKSSKLDDEQKVWTILFDVGFLTENLKSVKVSADDGSILGYE